MKYITFFENLQSLFRFKLAFFSGLFSPPHLSFANVDLLAFSVHIVFLSVKLVHWSLH